MTTLIVLLLVTFLMGASVGFNFAHWQNHCQQMELLELEQFRSQLLSNYESDPD